MPEFFANNYQTNLDEAGNITNSQTTFNVDSVTGRPAVNFRIKIDNELMLVTAVSSLQFTVTRGIEGTTAATHNDNALITHVLTAEAVTNSAHDDWTSYTPSFTAVTTNPTLGSSTLLGRYKKLDAKTYIIQINLIITTGGAWNAGSGSWQFSLPSGLTTPNVTGRTQVGSAHVLDSGTTHFSGTAKITSNQTKIDEVIIGDAANPKILSNNAPVTWATNDQVNINITLEVQ